MAHDTMAPYDSCQKKKSRFRGTTSLATLKILKDYCPTSNKVSCFGLKINNENIALLG